MIDLPFASLRGENEDLRRYLYSLVDTLMIQLNAELDGVMRGVSGGGGGDTIISKQVVTEELYADFGDIANLTVWKLRTDYQRAQRYLERDTRNIDYISIQGEQIDLITASTDGSRAIQLTRDDKPYFWTDASKSQMTMRQETEYPVMVYDYDELVKFSIRFEVVNGVVQPVVILGAGDGTGGSQAMIYKGTNGLYLSYKQSGGTETRSISLTDSGYVDIDRMRRPTKYNFSTIGSGYFTEAIDGDISTVYTVQRDSQNRINRIAEPDGHEIEVIW